MCEEFVSELYVLYNVYRGVVERSPRDTVDSALSLSLSLSKPELEGRISTAGGSLDMDLCSVLVFLCLSFSLCCFPFTFGGKEVKLPTLSFPQKWSK